MFGVLVKYGSSFFIASEDRQLTEKEVNVAKAAYEAGIPIPKVIDSPIKGDNREGFGFEGIDGPDLPWGHPWLR